MARQQTIGNLGEEKATLFLQEIGYKILERNWRFSKAEIDIIAKDGESLTTKTRSGKYFQRLHQLYKLKARPSFGGRPLLIIRVTLSIKWALNTIF